MAAPYGNQNAVKGKRWQQAIEAAIEAWPNEPSYENCAALIIGLRKAAHAYVSKMMAEKDITFFREFGDRLDGKPKQEQEISGSGGGPLGILVIPPKDMGADDKAG